MVSCPVFEVTLTMEKVHLNIALEGDASATEETLKRGWEPGVYMYLIANMPSHHMGWKDGG